MMTPAAFDAFLQVLAEMPLSDLLHSMRSVVEQLCEQEEKGLPLDTAPLHAMLTIVDRAIKGSCAPNVSGAQLPPDSPGPITTLGDYSTNAPRTQLPKSAERIASKSPEPSHVAVPVPVNLMPQVIKEPPRPASQGNTDSAPRQPKRPDLASMLSRNDRLILRRFLPAGASVSPDELLHQLDRQTSLASALELLQKHFPEQADNEAVQLLSTCLSRRFS